jgi:hypothetical protein
MTGLKQLHRAAMREARNVRGEILTQTLAPDG